MSADAAVALNAATAAVAVSTSVREIAVIACPSCCYPEEAIASCLLPPAAGIDRAGTVVSCFMPKINLTRIEQTNRTGYPAPYDSAVAGRWYRRLAPASGLTEFGVSHVVLSPGAWSSQRHWHRGEDEFLVIVAGDAVLVDDDGEHPMRPGDCAAFPKDDRNGHHLQNRSDKDCVFIVVGAGDEAGGDYSDIDMRFTADGRYVHKDGTPYDARRVR